MRNYFLPYDVESLAWHAQSLATAPATDLPIVTTRWTPELGGSEFLIYTPDREALFVRICGYFERAGFNIVEANIHTTRDGYALDSFLVMGKGPGAHYRDMRALIESELAAEPQSEAPLPPPGGGAGYLPSGCQGTTMPYRQYP